MAMPQLPSEGRTFRGYPRSPAWWGKIVPLGEQAELVREIEGVRALASEARAEISAHERECAVRYQTIQADTSAMRQAIQNIEGAVLQKTTMAIKVGWALNWKAWGVAIALLGALVGALGYETAQLYGLPMPRHERLATP